MSIIEKAIEKLERANRSGFRSDRAKSRGSDAGISDDEIADAVSPRIGKAETTHTADLDMKRIGTRRLITPETANNALAEQFRHIKRQILTDVSPNDFDDLRNANLIMITSPLPGEGKTFIAANLAMSITMERDRNVLLVDADMIKRDLSRMFGVEKQPGLNEFLSENARELADVLVKTNIPKLIFLPTGQPTQNMTELLASGKMKRFTRELSQRYSDRVVIFDSMPLLSKAGASVLAALMGQVVVVAQAVSTSHAALRDALALLDNADNVRLVLNKCQRRRGSRDRYGYYSDYG